MNRLSAITRTGWLAAMICLAATPAIAETISVNDDAGRTVTLDFPAQRIVTLAPHATELLYEVGAGDQIVGASEHSDYPEAARDIPRVGDYFSVNIEKIISLEPDLILAMETGNIADSLSRLAELGVPFFYTDPQNIEQIQDTQRRLGQLSGHPEQGEAAAQAFADGMSELADRFRDRAPVNTFYQVWHDPIYTVSNRNFIGELITLCGGNNVFGESEVYAPQVGRESVVTASPEVILTGDTAGLSLWVGVTQIPAVAGDHLYRVDPDNTGRPTSSLLAGAEEICQAIDRAR